MAINMKIGKERLRRREQKEMKEEKREKKKKNSEKKHKTRLEGTEVQMKMRNEFENGRQTRTNKKT